MDDEARYRAVESKDARFDGAFVTAVTTTGIYCRPSCPAVPPKRANVRFLPSAAAAQGAGFRACKRCRPDASPGSPEWDVRADLVGRAMRLIADGVVDRDGVAGLADRLGYSARQLQRQLVAEVGAGPLAVARAQRAQTARILLETTAMTIADVAFAAGFASVRQFNDTVRAVFAATPSALRAAAARRQSPPAPPGAVVVRLPVRRPFAGEALLRFLGDRAVPGVEELVDGTYRRVLRLPRGLGVAELALATDHVRCTLQLQDVRDLATAVQRCRRLLDLDADPIAVDAHLGADELLGPLVRATPGRRSPGTVDGDELAVRAVLGQQISVAGARTLAGRLTARYGAPLPQPMGALTHAFPTAAALAEADPADLPMPAARQRALIGLAAALAEGRVVLDAGADRAEAETALLALPGIGPWTAAYVAMRALGDPDVLMATDLGVRQALLRLGVPADPPAALARAASWRPWRSYATAHLWASLALPTTARAPAPASPDPLRRGA